MARVSGKNDAERSLSSIGGAIRALRRAKGVSQEALADAASIDRSHLGRIERGERNLTGLNLVRIAAALGGRGSGLLRDAGL